MKKNEHFRTVLLIDDDEGILDVTSRMMEKLGYHVLFAKTGDKALKTADTYKGPIIAALMDICLPEIQGKELYLRLVKIRPTMKVIIYSGYADEELINELLSMGANDFIQKPASLADLSSKLKNITDRRKHRRYILQKDAFAIINPLFADPCRINDISMGGLSFFSEQPAEGSNRTHEILLDIHNTDFTLDRVPCSLISNWDSQQISQQEQTKRFSLEFSELNNKQNTMLAFLLFNHTV